MLERVNNLKIRTKPLVMILNDETLSILKQLVLFFTFMQDILGTG